MGYLKKIGTTFIYISLLLAVITFLPGLPPDVTFYEYSYKLPTKLTGKLGINNRLNDPEFLHIGKFKGPESFDSYNGELYTGVEGGYVIKLNEKKIVPFVEFGGVYDQISNKYCKILGLKFDKKGNLYVIETYKGIYKVDPKGDYQLIIDSSEPINNKVPNIPNSLDIAENGDIYWTDSSTDFKLYDAVYSALSNPSGRLIRYNAATKTNEVLIENIMFANGVKLSKDESFLLVLETMASRILKYNLKGPKAGQHEILHEGIPGLPDNIHEDNNGGFLVSMYIYVDQENPNIIQTLVSLPNIRKMIVRLLMMIEAPFKLIQNIYPNFYAERIVHLIGSLDIHNAFLTPLSMVLHLDATGKLVDAAYSTDEKLKTISSVFIHKEYLWIGSPHNEFVSRVPLKQAFPHLAQTEKVYSNQQDTKEIPKIHSTTVKPSKTIEIPSTVQTSTITAKPVIKTAENVETRKSSKASSKQEKETTSKPSTTTTASTTTVKSSTTTAAPTTTVKLSTKSVPTTTTTTTTATTPTTTTTVKPSTASQTTQTAKVTTTTTTTKPIVKQNVETSTKSNNKEIKSETVKPVATKPNIPVDSTKQNVKINKITSDVKSENVKETKPELNKQTVQNTQSKIQK